MTRHTRSLGYRSLAPSLAHSLTAHLSLDECSHVLPDMQKSATQKLEDILFGRTGTLWAHNVEKAARELPLDYLILFEPRTNRL